MLGLWSKGYGEQLSISSLLSIVKNLYVMVLAILGRQSDKTTSPAICVLLSNDIVEPQPGRRDHEHNR